MTCCRYLLIISSRAFWCSSRAARNSLFSCCSVRICLKVKIYCNHKYCVQSVLNSNLCNASKCGGGLDLSHVRAFANVCSTCRLTHRDCFYRHQHFHIDIFIFTSINSFFVHFYIHLYSFSHRYIHFLSTLLTLRKNRAYIWNCVEINQHWWTCYMRHHDRTANW